MNSWKMTTFALLLVIGLVLGASAVNADRARPQVQPQMRLAIASLRDAKGHLDKATPDKGGHRVKALELVNAAIGEVQAGIDYDNTNP